jgi:hypothetical protein
MAAFEIYRTAEKRMREINGVLLRRWPPGKGTTPSLQFQVRTTRSRDRSFGTGQQRPPVHVKDRLRPGYSPFVMGVSNNCHFFVTRKARSRSIPRLKARSQSIPRLRMLVCRIVRSRWIVVTAVEVLVALRQGYLRQAQEAQRRGIFRNGNVPIQVLQ